MRALTVRPEQKHSARLEDVPEPKLTEGTVLVRSLLTGICGTDAEIVDGQYGWAPPGEPCLILGHESIGRVEQVAADCELKVGDLVVGIVRHPDPVPCPSCAAGEWDMCRNGLYTEHGIKELHGFCAERFAMQPAFLVRIPESLGQLAVLVEPASVLAKAWAHIEYIGHRAHWEPRRVLVTGAGPIGLLAALMGVQRGYRVHVFDRHTSGPKPELTRALGAAHHCGNVREALEASQPDIILECTGAAPVVIEAIRNSPRGAIVCLLGVSAAGRLTEVDLGELNRAIVLENDVVFGSVNANRRHYEAAVDALARADREWLRGLITRRVPLERWSEALQRQRDDVKVVIELAS
ncbi:MAG TPA: glucose 1-dehydrogenase [Steroidobacteraceae bacterium]